MSALDVGETPVDILACGGHKWLNSPFGAGFMYVRRGIWDRLVPPVAGYLAVTPPPDGWGAYFQTPSISPLQSVSFWPDARRFETGGTANYPGAIGLAASVRMINEIGTAQWSSNEVPVTSGQVYYLRLSLNSSASMYSTKNDVVAGGRYYMNDAPYSSNVDMWSTITLAENCGPDVLNVAATPLGGDQVKITWEHSRRDGINSTSWIQHCMVR